MKLYASIFITFVASLLLTREFCSGNESIGNNNKWAVLIAGSNGWFNYRHQADVCHAYHVVRSHGIPAEHIITFMYDDIAYNPKNPYPGKIFNNPDKVDVYENVFIDYKGEDVTRENIFNVLLGNEDEMEGTGSGKVLKSGPNDHVFIYYSDHGNRGIILVPGFDFISYHELQSVLEEMERRKKFKHLLFYLESCHSGSMFTTVPKNIDIFATTAANAHESSYACYCEHKDLPCLGDHFSVSWTENTEKIDVNSVTVEKQYKTVKSLVHGSNVCEFGDPEIKNLTIGSFFGGLQPRLRIVEEEVTHDHGVLISGEEHDFHYLHKQLHDNETGSEEAKQIADQIKTTLVDMKHVKEKFEIIAQLLSEKPHHFHEIISAKYEVKREHGQCFTDVLSKLLVSCFTTELEKQHIFLHSQKVVNMCAQEHLSQEKINRVIDVACKILKHEKADLEEYENCWMGENICGILCSMKGKIEGRGKPLGGTCKNDENICVCQ